MKKKKIIVKKIKEIIFLTFYNEDHTLGNVIRYLAQGNPLIEYAGYNVPHPSQNIMNLKISTKELNYLEPILIVLKNCGEICVLLGNLFNHIIENHCRFVI